MEAFYEYGITFTPVEDLLNMDAVIVAVSHEEFTTFGIEKIRSIFGNKHANVPVLFDLKGIYDRNKMIDAGFYYWRL